MFFLYLVDFSLGSILHRLKRNKSISNYNLSKNRANKQFNWDKKLAGYSLRSILAHNFLPVNRALTVFVNFWSLQIKIYILLIAIAVISFCIAFYAPIADVFKGVIAMPAVGAIFQLVRDDAAHTRKKEILLKEQHYSLAASSHMANVVFDKQVEFSDKYTSEVLKAFHTLMPQRDWEEAHSFAKNLTFIRLEYMCWLTTEIDENLEEFERKLHTLGANSSYIKMPKGEGTIQEHRDEAAREMLEIVGAFLYILEKTDKHPEARLSSLSKKMRKMLNVEELATLKNKLVDSSLQSNS